MPRSEDITGRIFCDKAIRFVPDFGKSQKAKATNDTTKIIK